MLTVGFTHYLLTLVVDELTRELHNEMCTLFADDIMIINEIKDLNRKLERWRRR